MSEMWSIGRCPVCETGPLGLRICGSCNAMVLLCDECDTAMLTLEADSPKTLATEEAMPCPGCGDSLWSDKSHWASEQEALAEPWLSERVESGEVTLERGAAFERDDFGEDS